MRLPSDLAGVVTEKEPLAPHASYGVGGSARWFARPRTREQLAGLVSCCRDMGVDLQVLGLGANLLISDDGVNGMVVRLNSPAFREVDWGNDTNGGASPDPGAGRRGAQDDDVAVTAGGGADMSRLALDAVRHGLTGLECMAGIPGTLGGIIRMNAGGRFGDISGVVRDITVLDLSGRVRKLPREQVGFRYRGSNLEDVIICSATLILKRGDPNQIRERFLEIWEYKRRSQPLAEFSAGCVFKNPPGRSAGELIDRAGLKGRRVGGASVSDHHANFIVAQEGATAGDILTLIALIRRTVAERFGVELELEIEVWGHQPALMDGLIA